MRAFVADAIWDPKKDYSLTDIERTNKKAFVGSQVWRNSNFIIRDVPIPEIEDDEVLIRIKFCGICGSDTHVYEMDKDGYIIFSGLSKFPCIPGHEFSGIVERIGRRVISLREGDPVAVESIQWCGVCTMCRSGSPNQCENIELLGLSVDGAFADYIRVKERLCWPITSLMQVYTEEEMFKFGALIEPIGCSYNGIFVSGRGVTPGDTFVVYGVGPLGLAAVALAKISGASKIIAFDIIEERLRLAKKMGADFGFNTRSLMKEGVRYGEMVLEITHGEGADIQVETAGAAPETIPEMERSMAPRGKIIYLGRAATSTPMFLDSLVSGANMIVGSRGHSGYGIFPKIIKLMGGGKLDMRPMITSMYAFEDIKEAFEASCLRKDGKILVEI